MFCPPTRPIHDEFKAQRLAGMKEKRRKGREKESETIEEGV